MFISPIRRPHDPLHVPDTELDLYRAEYNDGYEQIAEQRLARIKVLGLIDPDITRPPRLPMIPAWNELPANVRADYARRMEIYAAMVEVMDREIGRFLTFLEDRQSLENTVVIFMSDNGAAPANLSFYGFTEDDFDNSAGNMGRPGSFTSYGPGWAQAGSVPSAISRAAPARVAFAPLSLSPDRVFHKQGSSIHLHMSPILRRPYLNTPEANPLMTTG